MKNKNVSKEILNDLANPNIAIFEMIRKQKFSIKQKHFLPNS